MNSHSEINRALCGRPTLTKDMLTMHAEDSADDAIIAEQLGHHAVTRSQAQAMGRAVQTPFIAASAAATRYRIRA